MAKDSHHDKDAADHAVCLIEKFRCRTEDHRDSRAFGSIVRQEQIIRDLFGVPEAKDILEGRKSGPGFYPCISGAVESDDCTVPKVRKTVNHFYPYLINPCAGLHRPERYCSRIPNVV